MLIRHPSDACHADAQGIKGACMVVIPPLGGRLPPCVKPLHSLRCWPSVPTHNSSLSRCWDVPNGIRVQVMERFAPTHEAEDANPHPAVGGRIDRCGNHYRNHDFVSRECPTEHLLCKKGESVATPIPQVTMQVAELRAEIGGPEVSGAC